MKTMNHSKKIYIGLFVLMAGGLILVADNAEAVYRRPSSSSSSYRRPSSSSSSYRRPSTSSSSYHRTTSSSSHRPSAHRPAGGSYRPNSFGTKSLTGHCKNIHGYCVAFSSHGCGNFYIKGYHYGGSRACSILGVHCGSGRRSTGGSGSSARPASFGGVTRSTSHRTTTVRSTTSTATLTTSFARSCTPGTGPDACPADDLGDIITGFYLNPSYANSKTNTCPLFWVPGKENANAKITCKLETNGVESPLPKTPAAAGYPNGFPVSPGKHRLICTRTYTDVVDDGDGTSHEEYEDFDQEALVNCRAYPQIREI